MTRLEKMMKWVAALFAIGFIFICLIRFGFRPTGRDCVRQSSPDGAYVAERCVLEWRPGGNSDYQGKVYDSKSGRLLVDRTFSTPVPDLSWSEDSVAFSRGGDESSFVTLPPTWFDRLKAAIL